jgi:acetyl-CoA carboxylase carboxyl transferase subunit alpha
MAFLLVSTLKNQEDSMLDFEKPILELEARMRELEASAAASNVNTIEEITRLKAKVERLRKSTYAALKPQQRVQVARHERRPHFIDYVAAMITDFTPLAGDRLFADDAALLGGLGRFRGQPVVILGQEKGHDLNTRLHHNFGMPRPEGYRKAMRLMRLADTFGLPVITLVDTAGAYPGLDAEARGQAEAIAQSIATCLSIKVPLVSVVVGEGGSGGAIAIAAADRVYMLENSVYSVISPEGCASILWRSASFAGDAAAALKLTAQDLLALKLIDGIIPEPLGGAHSDRAAAIGLVADQIDRALRDLVRLTPEQRHQERRKKFLAMGRNLSVTDEKSWFSRA